MLSLRDFWRRHRRKIFVTAGVLGSGYLLHKLYNAHRQRLAVLERELESERQNDELIKAQMQAHFDSIQKIADSTTLPHAMRYLNSRIMEELDVYHLMERLMKGKDQPNPLTSAEKIYLWDKLKILSFTRMVLSLWSMTILNLYIRVQVNILGRHLYINTARDLGSSQLLEDPDLIDRDSQQKFLESADFLPAYGLPALKSNMQVAAKEVLQRKQLRDFFKTTDLSETIMQILGTFMSTKGPHNWLDYLMPEDARLQTLATASNNDTTVFSDVTEFDQLMAETRAVLTSAEFGSIAEMALKAVVDAVVKEMEIQSGEGNLGTPLARLIPRVTKMGPELLEEPSKNQFIQVIRNVPEVELFFTLLYSNMPFS
ncbi:hypothetical protein FNV43_RR19960 [Rhamnella rubrinervis]|uniref:Uncharacterized protein n=1 Tax=Rhamnella rubrinervis TaxID=2594499 RepID=A0A8K0DTK5_9ROSA|nr:hypothetical protein FNV43_RR19960 [Rhamnella rubrinervis]